MSTSRGPDSGLGRRANAANSASDNNAEEHEPPRGDAPPGGDVSRREFLGSTGVAVLAANAVPLSAQEAPAAPDLDAELAAVPKTAIAITVNGTAHRLEVEDRWTLNELLRDHVGLTGSKIGCNRGECGACTVLMDGKPVYSCSTLAVWADGRTIVTVEGLERGGKVSPLQQTFMDHNAAQCGFCTSGQLMTATALLEHNPQPTVAEVRGALAGNLCRCSNYNAIVEAVMAAAETGAA
jgi:xanthine dehydrogenase YagT iron-sulfur-binding subunit